MSDERKQSLFIIAYEGKDTADEVYKTLRGLEKQKLRDLDIKTAATVHRKDNGKLKLEHKRRVTVGWGTAGGAALGLLFASTGVGVLAAAGVGALVGSSRSGDRKDVKEFLEDKLGPNDSALAILISDADWEAVEQATASYGGTDLKVELTEDAQQKIAALAEKDDVAEAVAEEVEVDDEDVEEVSEDA
jgi:uncharacterized membrane protein